MPLIYKDLVIIIGILIIFYFNIVFMNIEKLIGNVDNLIYANPLITPTHIIPE